MKLTTKGRYAVTAMLDLAIHDQGEPTALADIADRQGLSLSYLEQLFAQLRRAGLVSSVRGPGGGYRLAHVPERINIADVVVAVDEQVSFTKCDGRGDCRDGQKCLAHELWMRFSDQIRDFLSGVTLADLVTQPDVLEIAVRQDDALRRQRAERLVGQSNGQRGLGVRND